MTWTPSHPPICLLVLLTSWLQLPLNLQTTLAAPFTHHLPQPEQSPATDKQWDSDEGSPTQEKSYEQPAWDPEGSSSENPNETPSWEDETALTVQPYETPNWEDDEAATETEASRPGWEDGEEAGWGTEGSQVGR